jgi:hypothetical protein
MQKVRRELMKISELLARRGAQIAAFDLTGSGMSRWQLYD